MERLFRLIDLPSIPLRMVFHRMDAPQLYILSTLRRELTDLIVSLKIPVEIDVFMMDSTCYISLRKKYKCWIRWNFSSDDFDRPGPYLVEVILYSLCRALSNVCEWQCMEHPRNIISRLTRIFQCPQLHVALHMNSFSYLDWIFGENDFDRCSELRLEGGSCNTEQMDRLRRTLKRVDSVYSEADMNADVESRKWLLNSKHLYIMQPDNHREGWFTSEDLMVSTCSSYDILKHQLTEQDLNQFIRKWIDNQSPQLRSFDVYFTRDVRREEVMRDLDLRPYDPNRFPSHQTSECYKLLSYEEDAYESNGRFISFNFIGFYFHIRVWHDE